MKRILSCYTSDFSKMSATDLRLAIKASEGRTVLAETIVTAAPLLEGITNAEVMRAFGADLICLNELDILNPAINGFGHGQGIIKQLKELVGLPIGINLEPVDAEANTLDDRQIISAGRQASINTYQAAARLGIDFIMLTGNPSTAVSNVAILEAVKLAQVHYPGLIFAGKMHAAGLAEAVVDADCLIKCIEAGATGVILPSVGTVPAWTLAEAYKLTKQIHALGGLVMNTIGTSQESADKATIRQFAIYNKQAGADIHHIGDASYGRMAPPENIMAYSIAIRGKRHTYYRMASSIKR